MCKIQPNHLEWQSSLRTHPKKNTQIILGHLFCFVVARTIHPMYFHAESMTSCSIKMYAKCWMIRMAVCRNQEKIKGTGIRLEWIHVKKNVEGKTYYSPRLARLIITGVLSLNMLKLCAPPLYFVRYIVVRSLFIGPS